jgi:1-acyl-sn-glycerol-3-phosphate acyltransferase
MLVHRLEHVAPVPGLRRRDRPRRTVTASRPGPDPGTRPSVAGATRLALEAVAPRLWPVRVEGLDAVPSRGPAILAANHLSFFDSVVLVLAAPRPLAFVGKSEYLDRWKTRHLFPALGMIPIDRGGGRRALHALDAAAEVLAGGGLFAIYPEGTRSRDGLLHQGHRGVGQLAIATGAPVIPVGITGTKRIQPPGARVPRPFRTATVRFGQPLLASGYRGSARERRRHLTADVMAAIGSLSGQPVAPPAGATTG